jgi:Lar family restriction alleviation protein
VEKEARRERKESTMSTELEPCPFCGGQAATQRETLDERYAYADVVKVQCTACGVAVSATGDTSKPGYADNSTTEKRAVAAWNRRTEPSAMPSDEAIERAALKHMAPGWPQLAAIAKLDPDYKKGEQFARIKAVVQELAAGALSGDAKDEALRDALNTTLWLYRRLPVAYGKPPFVDIAIMEVAKHLGMDDVPIAIKERASLIAHTKAGSGK